MADVTLLPLMELTTGFWASRVLAAAEAADLFTKLSGTQGVTLEQGGALVGFAGRPAEMLLTACCALGLLDKRGDRYVNSELAEEFLVQGKPFYFGGFIRFLHERDYPAWAELGTALRTGRPVTWDAGEQPDGLFSASNQKMDALFWSAMHSISMSTARVLARHVDFSATRRLLDVGGGSGAFPIVLCQQHPDLTATVLELPHVTEIADSYLRQAGLGGRVGVMAGDFLADPGLPAGHDAILLSSILHDWDAATGRALLAKCHEALPPGGTVLILELIMDDDRAGPAPAALMSLEMLVQTVGGKNWTEGEYHAWLAEAGFTDVRTIRLEAPGANGAVIGRKP